MSRRIVFVAATLGAFLGAAPIAQQVFRATTDVVTVGVSVLDGNKPVTDLTVTDFEILDNGVAQTVDEARYETVPIDLTLLLDVSGSVQGARLANLLKAANTVRARLRPEDESRLVTFGQRIIEVPATRGQAIPSLAAFTQVTSRTSVNDALIVALAHLQAPTHRPLIIVCTDGVDTLSLLEDDVVLDVARHSEAAVFVLAPPSPRSEVRSASDPQSLLNRLATASGGRVEALNPTVIIRSSVGNFRTTADLVDMDLSSVFLRALDDFRLSYLLRFTSKGVPKPGWHDLTVRVKRPGNFTIRARKGYFGS